MIFATFFITYLTFPSLILSNKMPFLDRAHDWSDKLYAVALLCLLNIGMSYLGSALGALVANCCCHIKMSGRACAIVLILELFLTSLIIVSVLTSESSWESWQAAVSLPSILLQALVHSLAATHFLTLKPTLRQVPLEF